MGLENNVLILHEKYERMKREEVRFERYKVSQENRLMIVSYGTMARICQTAIDELEHEDVSVGLFRPVTLFPFPENEIFKEATKKNIRSVLTIEMSTGQMIDDVQRAVMGKKSVEFYGRTGGIVPAPEDVRERILKVLGPKNATRRKKSRG